MVSKERGDVPRARLKRSEGLLEVSRFKAMLLSVCSPSESSSGMAPMALNVPHDSRPRSNVPMAADDTGSAGAWQNTSSTVSTGAGDSWEAESSSVECTSFWFSFRRRALFFSPGG